VSVVASLQSNDYELFGLTPQFALDRAALDTRWKDLQREAHPDKFAAQGAAAQRVAMQWSVRINEAYQRLKDPLKRAAYLCELRGAPIQAHDNTAMPAAFLMQQMTWREDLDEATSLDDLEKIRDQVTASFKELLQLCEQLLDTQHDAVQAAAQVRSLMFIDKFIQDIDTRIDLMERAG
jgi:molecular chaperone HscB